MPSNQSLLQAIPALRLINYYYKIKLFLQLNEYYILYCEFIDRVLKKNYTELY